MAVKPDRERERERESQCCGDLVGCSVYVAEAQIHYYWMLLYITTRCRELYYRMVLSVCLSVHPVWSIAPECLLLWTANLEDVFPITRLTYTLIIGEKLKLKFHMDPVNVRIGGTVLLMTEVCREDVDTSLVMLLWHFHNAALQHKPCLGFRSV